jgi:hypothetical protein
MIWVLAMVSREGEIECIQCFYDLKQDFSLSMCCVNRHPVLRKQFQYEVATSSITIVGRGGQCNRYEGDGY